MKLEIQRFDHFGRGITYWQDKICFVIDALPQEIVEAHIISDKKKYQVAVVDSYLKTSSQRMEPDCPFFRECGGCDLRHIGFDDENQFKMQKMVEVMRQYGRISSDLIQPIIFDSENYYRNKIVLHSNHRHLGFYGKNSHDIISINHCLLIDKRMQDIVSLLQGYADKIDDVMIRISNDKKYILLSLNGNIVDCSFLIDCVDFLYLNGTLIKGKEPFISPIGNFSFVVGLNSFFQVNRTLTKELYDKVLSYVSNIKPTLLLDLYCGSGTIGIYVHSFCKRVIGVECNPSNILDAHQNAKLNQVSNIEFIENRVENVISQFNNFDCVIVDPPRVGLDSKTRNVLKSSRTSYIIYVSCDPVTLARDLKALQEFYKVIEITPFNMFPRTFHVESICVLKLK